MFDSAITAAISSSVKQQAVNGCCGAAGLGYVDASVLKNLTSIIHPQGGRVAVKERRERRGGG